MTKLGRKAKQLVKQGKFRLVPANPPHVHHCLECNELIPCYNRDEANPFCRFVFSINPCWECFTFARLGYRRYKPPNIALINNQIGLAWLSPFHWGTTMAALDSKFIPLSASHARYWNILYMDEINTIAQGLEWRSTIQKVSQNLGKLE